MNDCIVVSHTNMNRLHVPLFIRGRIQAVASEEKRKKAGSFNFTFCYIDDVLLLRNSTFDDSLIASIPLSLKYKEYHRYS